jgi:hypothetical protein
MLGNTGSLRNAWRLSTIKCSERGLRLTQPFYNWIGSCAPIRSPQPCRLRVSGVRPRNLILAPTHIVLAIREMSLCPFPWYRCRSLTALPDLLYMHRGFFARALNDHPKDPLGSPYGTSVIAAYRSAGSLIALMRNLHSQLQQPMERMWFLWTHMFSCAVGLITGI